MSGVNFIAFAMFPLIFILPYKTSTQEIQYGHEGVLGVQFTSSHGHEVIIEHGEGGVNGAFLTLGNFTYRYD